MDAPAETVKDYFDQHSDVYSAWYRPDTPDGWAFLERKAVVLQCVGNHPGVLLDVGCGSGVMTIELARHATTYIGTDVAPNMIEAAKKVAHNVPNVKFHVSEVTHIPVDTESIDTACAIGLLEYLTDVEAALSELHRAIRPGGRLIASMPYLCSPWRLWEQFAYLPLRNLSSSVVPLRTPYPLTHRYYSVAAYNRLMLKCGFRTDQVEFYNLSLIPRPLDVLFPVLTARAAQFASCLRHTPLRVLGTGFVASATKI